MPDIVHLDAYPPEPFFLMRSPYREGKYTLGNTTFTMSSASSVPIASLMTLRCTPPRPCVPRRLVNSERALQCETPLTEARRAYIVETLAHTARENSSLRMALAEVNRVVDALCATVPRKRARAPSLSPRASNKCTRRK